MRTLASCLRTCLVDTDKPYSMICNAYAQLGARGTTVIFSSGDGGVSGHKPEDSTFCDGGRPFAPTFPSTCPLYAQPPTPRWYLPNRTDPSPA